MRNILLFWLFFLLISVLYAQTQERIISGRLTGSDGSALPGVSIAVKGTTTGTTTDANGNYRIVAPLGATLVFSFVGFTTREVLVTEKNSFPTEGSPAATTPGATTGPAKKPSRQPSRNSISKKGKTSPPATGVAVLQDDAPVFATPNTGRLQEMTNPSSLPPAYSIRYVKGWWARIRYGSQARNGLFLVDTRTNTALPFQVSFTSVFTIDQINRLPALQSEYAQGRPLNGLEIGQGPETGEIFSWGPKIRNLEFDGLAYPYDANGRLVPKGTGNGTPARVYNPYAFFRNGITTDQNLTVKTRLRQRC